ncbi:metallophosphoesterase family protein [Aquipuribacter hungaricus]|uniref:Metallophosphoesterase family protein n=1 Tax=Aquipuribacter hungaricus TaxID=545624 RepID=A0ABV7WJU0_9MICO
MASPPPTVLGLVGDPHAEDELLEHALDLLAVHQPDVLLCTGDVVDGRGDVDRTVRLLRDAGVVTVRGNHDRWLLEGEARDLRHAHRADDLDALTRTWLEGLPAAVRLPLGVPGGLLLCHGLDDDDMNRLRADDVGYSLEQNEVLLRLLEEVVPPAVVVKGHTHRPGAARFGLGTDAWGLPVPRAGGDLLVVDAGTLTRDHGPTCSVVDLRGGSLTRYDLLTGGHRTSPLPTQPAPAP